MSSDNVYHLAFGKRADDRATGDLHDASRDGPVQLSLPFAAPHLLVFTLTPDFNVAGLFQQFAQSLRPRLLIDMRMSPRLEFIGTTRSQTFDYFKSMQIDYKDVFGKVGIGGYVDAEERHQVLGIAVAQILETFEPSEGPALFFFDDPGFMSRCRRSFEAAFEIVDMDRQSIQRRAVDSSLLQM